MKTYVAHEVVQRQIINNVPFQPSSRGSTLDVELCDGVVYACCKGGGGGGGRDHNGLDQMLVVQLRVRPKKTSPRQPASVPSSLKTKTAVTWTSKP